MPRGWGGPVAIARLGNDPQDANWNGTEGTARAAAERQIREGYFVIRTCGLYGAAGSSGKGGNFVENMLKKATAGEAIRVVADQVLTPTYTMDLAEVTRSLIMTGAFGLYHLSSEGQCSWYEFTRSIFACAGIAAQLTAVKTVRRPARRR